MSTFSFLRDKPQWRIMLERDKIGIGYEYPETVRDHAAEATRKIDSIIIRAAFKHEHMWATKFGS